MNGETFVAAFEGLIRTILREEIRAALHPSIDEQWFDQRRSPLGSRRHCAATRRRATEGKPDAKKVGDRFLMTAAAITEELERLGRPKALTRADTSKTPLSPEDEVRERIQRRLQRGM